MKEVGRTLEAPARADAAGERVTVLARGRLSDEEFDRLALERWLDDGGPCGSCGPCDVAHDDVENPENTRNPENDDA